MARNMALAEETIESHGWRSSISFLFKLAGIVALIWIIANMPSNPFAH
jgi:hypothetical protein